MATTRFGEVGVRFGVARPSMKRSRWTSGKTGGGIALGRG